MKRLSVLLLVCCAACATLRTSSGSLNWPVLLSDAQFGISAACSQQWLNAAECAIATDAITTTQAVIAKEPTNIKASVHKTVGDVIAKLPADSRVIPYLDWVAKLSA